MKGTPRNSITNRLPFTQAAGIDESFAKSRPSSVERSTKHKNSQPASSPWLTCRNNRGKKGTLAIQSQPNPSEFHGKPSDVHCLQPFQSMLQQMNIRITSLSHRLDLERSQRIQSFNTISNQVTTKQPSACSQLDLLKDYLLEATKTITNGHYQRIIQKLAEENDRIKNSMHVQEQEMHRLIVEASRDTTKRLGELQGRCGDLERMVEEGEFRARKEAGELQTHVETKLEKVQNEIQQLQCRLSQLHDQQSKLSQSQLHKLVQQVRSQVSRSSALTVALTQNSEQQPLPRSQFQQCFSSLIQSCNCNFVDLQTTTNQLACLTKQMIDISGMMVRKMTEFSSSTRFDVRALETFFEYVNVRIGAMTSSDSKTRIEKHCRTLSDSKENLGVTGKLALRRISKGDGLEVLYP